MNVSSSGSHSPFYITGGTVPYNAASYVSRNADTELLEALRTGHFCYVLTSRQMGKSSLMTQTAARLRGEGITCAGLDLTAIGQNLSVEQWYDGLVSLLGRALDLEDEMEDFWLAHERLSPLQRWLQALRDVVLAKVAGPIVISIDEIDAVRSLPFSADEFFASIRACYNRRTEDPEYLRLTFCLLGVATPADLIQDTRTTPFNIGKRIELTDFTDEEAAPLAAGLTYVLDGEAIFHQKVESEALLKRVVYWTGGHPYLTQRLCSALAEQPPSSTPTNARVDQLCADLFLSSSARERDDNLLFVRERLLRSDADIAGLLLLYRQVWEGRRVPVDETNPLISLLRLSGITRVTSGLLKPRNRIYATVFNKAWIVQHMPDAELRRQRAAYRKGWTRAVAVSSVIIIAMGALALTAIRYARQANDDRFTAHQVQAREDLEHKRTEALLYASDMNVAQQAWERGDLEWERKLIRRNHPEALRYEDLMFQPRFQGLRQDRRGFEWYYLSRLSRGDERATLTTHIDVARALAFSPDRRVVAYGGQDNAITLWDLASQKERATLPVRDPILSMAFSPNGKSLVSGSLHGTVIVWDVGSHKATAAFDNNDDGVCSVAFSPDGATLASGHKSGAVKIWDILLRHGIVLKAHVRPVDSVAFSPDGSTLATGSEDTTIRLWNVVSHRAVTLDASQGILSVAFSPDGKILAAGGINGLVELWNVVAKRMRLSLVGHKSLVDSVAFSPDGKSLATGSSDCTIKLWSVEDGKDLATLRGHTAAVYAVAFSANGAALVTASGDHTIKEWSTTLKPDAMALVGHKSRVVTIAFAPDSRTLASAGEDGMVKLWDLASRKERTTLPVRDPVISMAFSPDGRTLLTGSLHGTLMLWDITSRKVSATLDNQGDGVSSVAFSPDGTEAAAGCLNGIVQLWDVATSKVLFKFRPHDGPLCAVAFSPDSKGRTPYSKTLFTSGGDGFAKLWSLRSVPPILRDKIPVPSSRGLAVSPDGTALAVSSANGFVKLWDLSSGSPSRPPHILNVPSPHGVAFSPDGRTLAIASLDNTIRLWNVPTHPEWYLALPQEMLTLKGYSAPVLTVEFSPDGHLLASAGWDTRIRLWQAPAK